MGPHPHRQAGRRSPASGSPSRNSPIPTMSCARNQCRCGFWRSSGSGSHLGLGRPQTQTPGWRSPIA
eukprot:13702615-Alexandrium_andersonii.AAC.1